MTAVIWLWPLDLPFVVCQSGLGEGGSLLWTTQPTSAQEAQIDSLFRGAYQIALARIRDNRALFDRIVSALIEKQELSGDELRRLASVVQAP